MARLPLGPVRARVAPSSVSSPIASCSEAGSRYSNLAGYMGALHLLGGVFDGFDDVDVAGAAAQIAFDTPLDLVVGRIRIGLQQVDRLHDHPGGAEAALH